MNIDKSNDKSVSRHKIIEVFYDEKGREIRPENSSYEKYLNGEKYFGSYFIDNNGNVVKTSNLSRKEEVGNGNLKNKKQEEEEPEKILFSLPVYLDSDERGHIDGSIIVYQERIEIRKIFQPNFNHGINEIELIKGEYSKTESQIVKQHNGLAVAANILNMFDYMLSGNSIGYLHDGYISTTPYIAHYAEKISIILKSKKTFSIRYTMTDDYGDLKFTELIKKRAHKIDEFNAIIKTLLEKNKKDDFDDWYAKNVSIKTQKENDFDEWCKKTIEELDNKREIGLREEDDDFDDGL